MTAFDSFLRSGRPVPSDPEASFAFGLTLSDVEEFREILRTECGEELPLAESWSRATEILGLFRMMLGPIPEDRSAGPAASSNVLSLDTDRDLRIN